MNKIVDPFMDHAAKIAYQNKWPTGALVKRFQKFRDRVAAEGVQYEDEIFMSVFMPPLNRKEMAKSNTKCKVTGAHVSNYLHLQLSITGWPCDKLASKLGVHINTVYTLLNNPPKKTHSKTIENICSTFKCTPDDIIRCNTSIRAKKNALT